MLSNDELIMIAPVGNNAPTEVSKYFLSDIIQWQVEEILRKCAVEIDKSGLAKQLGAGIVLTGGTALMKGIIELGRLVFQAPVNIGYPTSGKYSGLSSEIESPIYSTAVGLALHSLHFKNNSVVHTTEKVSLKDNDENIPIQNNTNESVINKVKNFFTNL